MGIKDRIKICILVSFSVIFMYFKIVLPIFPSFLNFELSDIPIFFISLAFSPISGVVAMGMKNILSFILIGSVTYGIGEFANFLLGGSFVYFSSIVFLKLKGNKKYVLSFLCGSFVLTSLGVFLNYFLILPIYAWVFGTSISLFIGKNTTLLKFLILYLVPFNILKSIIIYFPTILIFNKFKKINSRNSS